MVRRSCTDDGFDRSPPLVLQVGAPKEVERISAVPRQLRQRMPTAEETAQRPQIGVSQRAQVSPVSTVGCQAQTGSPAGPASAGKVAMTLVPFYAARPGFYPPLISLPPMLMARCGRCSSSAQS